MELYEKDKLDEQRKRDNGDFFNVFNTIGLWSEEVRLHSSFIAELLNPKGSHGLTHRFLQAFIEELDLDLPADSSIFNVVHRVLLKG